MIALARQANDPRVYVGDGVTRRHLASPAEVADIQWMIGQGRLEAKTSEVLVVDRIGWLGVDVTDAPTAATITTALAPALAQSLAGPISAALAQRLQVLTDLDIERIRDAAVEALELSKGTLNTSTNVMRFNRVAQQ